MTDKGEVTLEVVVPVAEYQAAEQGGRQAQRSGLRDKAVLLLPSQKSSSPPFINALVQRMTAATPAKRVFTLNPDWPYFHPTKAAVIPGEIDEVSKGSDLAVVGIAY